jgi:hypothetical protein
MHLLLTGYTNIPLKQRQIFQNVYIMVTVSGIRFTCISKYQSQILVYNMDYIYIESKQKVIQYHTNIHTSLLWHFTCGVSSNFASIISIIRTSVLFLSIVTLRPVPLQDVFLLPIQSVGTLTYLTKIAFCLCVLVRFLLVIFYFWFCFLS